MDGGEQRWVQMDTAGRMPDAGCEDVSSNPALRTARTDLRAAQGRSPDLPRGAARQGRSRVGGTWGWGCSEREAPEFVLEGRTGAEQTKKCFIRFSAV